MTMPMMTSSTGSISVTNRPSVGLDLLVVEVGQAVQHLLQRAGRLADLDHLHGHVREHRRAPQRRGEATRPRAPAAPPPRARSAMKRLPDRLERDVERVHQRDAAAEQRRQRPRHLRRSRTCCDARPDARHAQHQPVEPRLLPRPPHPRGERRPCGRRSRQQEPAAAPARRRETPTMTRVTSGSSAPKLP